MRDSEKLILILEMAKMYMIRRRKRQRRIRRLYGMYMCQQLMLFRSLLLSNKKKRRSCWSKTRTSSWWDNIVLKTFDNSDWIKNLRVDKTTFFDICEMVRADLEPKPNVLRARLPILVEKTVAVALYKFASCAEMRVIGNNMGLSKTSVHRCVRRFTDAMLKHATKFICMPSEEEARVISEIFFNICKIPQILLVIDGTHVPVLAPKDGHGDFVNRKEWTSYNVQLVADVNYVIRDVSCGFPGSTHDAYVFKNSGLFESGGSILPKSPKRINNVDIDYVILGDPAYPLMSWLIKGFTGDLTETEESFNAYMNSARIVIEQTIGKLKSRWRILKKINEMDYSYIPKVVVVCCILHNIIQQRKISYPAIVDDDISNPTVLEQPQMRNMSRLIFPRRQEFDEIRQQGEKIRQALKLITDKLPLRKQIVLKK